MGSAIGHDGREACYGVYKGSNIYFISIDQTEEKRAKRNRPKRDLTGYNRNQNYIQSHTLAKNSAGYRNGKIGIIILSMCSFVFIQS